MSKTTIEFANSPSQQAIQGAWQVIAASLSRRTGMEIKPVFREEKEVIKCSGKECAST